MSLGIAAVQRAYTEIGYSPFTGRQWAGCAFGLPEGIRIEQRRPSMRFVRKALRILGILLLALAVIAAGVGTWLVRRPWPQTKGNLVVAGLTAPPSRKQRFWTATCVPSCRRMPMA
jgi:hypothetical protein